MLPNSKNAVFPKQVTIDMNQSCLYGMTVLFDRSIPVEDITAAIDERYGKWACPRVRKITVENLARRTGEVCNSIERSQ